MHFFKLGEEFHPSLGLAAFFAPAVVISTWPTSLLVLAWAGVFTVGLYVTWKLMKLVWKGVKGSAMGWFTLVYACLLGVCVFAQLQPNARTREGWDVITGAGFVYVVVLLTWAITRRAYRTPPPAPVARYLPTPASSVKEDQFKEAERIYEQKKRVLDKMNLPPDERGKAEEALRDQYLQKLEEIG
jgi:hypothetical protein